MNHYIHDCAWIQPRETPVHSHACGHNGGYTVAVKVTDDDLGFERASQAKVVVADCDWVRNQGIWKQQIGGKGKTNTQTGGRTKNKGKKWSSRRLSSDREKTIREAGLSPASLVILSRGTLTRWRGPRP